ncbi:MAG: T9SS type A sorting domain-containing protein [Candidatus Krumholzibacteria bacterium]|nr:T9SS type A sorting domain-containing protein [Candidatus Krumholzibacteria bacterium]
MSRLAHYSAFFVTLLISTSTAGLVVEPISNSAVDCDYPSVAQSHTQRTLVAWQDAEQQIWTCGLPTFPTGGDGAFRVPQHHGDGHSPKVVLTWQGLMLTWAAGSRIFVNFAYDTEFLDPPRVIETGYDLTYVDLDVHGVAAPGWDVAWITFEATGADLRQSVLLLRLYKSNSEDITVIADDLDMDAFGAPQVTEVPSWPQPLPRVYYFRDGQTLCYRSEAPDSGWLPEETVPFPGYYGTAFDVAASASGAQYLLSLGPQPTCPCNVIHASDQNIAGVWSEPRQLTLHYCYFDWPRSPVIRADSQGRVHAFWLQRGANEIMELERRDLEYWVWNANGWTDRGDPLDGYESVGLSDNVAMALTTTDQPVFAWTFADTIMGVPQPRQIMLARPDQLVAVQHGATPVAPASLDAWPNPFNPQVNLTGTLPPGEQAALAVYDLAGRRVASFAVQAAADGLFAARWNGTDHNGRAAPSGVYLVRLRSDAGSAVRRVVLAR